MAWTPEGARGHTFYRAAEAEDGTEHSPTAGSVQGTRQQGDCHFVERIGEAQIKELARSLGNLRIPSHPVAGNPLRSVLTVPGPFLPAPAQVPPLGA